MATEPDILVRDLLRNRLTDPNSSRVGEYVVEDFPWETSLTINNFPRVSVMEQFDSSRPFGLGSTNAIVSDRLQLDIWVKPDQVLTVSGTPYEGFKQVRWIKRTIINALHSYSISDLVATGDVLYLNVINWYPPKLDYTFNLVRQTSDVTFSIYKP
jgi:hypothetical protein